MYSATGWVCLEDTNRGESSRASGSRPPYFRVVHYGMPSGPTKFAALSASVSEC
jgi:hypothetical protein